MKRGEPSPLLSETTMKFLPFFESPDYLDKCFSCLDLWLGIHIANTATNLEIFEFPTFLIE
jgi:hypothetical protein